jgi:hypothetical protein
LNEFSNSYANFRASNLVRKFGKAKLDPIDLAKSSATIALRSNVSRKIQCEVLEEVEKQTGEKYTRVILERNTIG